MKQKTIYISDLDGTLLGTDSRISQRSASIIDELSVRGALVTVATARTPATVVPLLAGISTNAPAIVMTGCARWERADACFSHVHFVPSAEVAGALDICRCCGVHPFVYVMADDDATLDVYHGAPVLNKAEENFWSERCNLPLKRFHLGTCSSTAWGRRSLCAAQPRLSASTASVRYAAIPIFSTLMCIISRYSRRG